MVTLRMALHNGAFDYDLHFMFGVFLEKQWSHSRYVVYHFNIPK